MAGSWEEVAAAHRAKQESCIDPKWLLSPQALKELVGTGQSDEGRLVARRVAEKSGILTDKEVEITERYSVRSLLDEMASGKLSAEEVTVAFCKRAALAQQLVRFRGTIQLRFRLLADSFFWIDKLLDRDILSRWHTKGPRAGSVLYRAQKDERTASRAAY